MKTSNYLVAIALLACSSAASLKAQDEITNIFKSGLTDLNKVANGYMKPAGNSLAAGLGSNWYNTAEVHKTFGFDLTIGGSVVMSPQSERMFDITGLTNLKPTVAGTTQAPTFTGSGSGVGLALYQPDKLSNGTANPLKGQQIVSFTTPKGVSKYIPAPTVQFTIGLPFINDLSIRWMPKVKASDADVSLIGIGVKHNFKQWIPGIKLLPFDASVLVAYTHLNANYYFPTSDQITPDKLLGNNLAYDPSQATGDYKTQSLKINAKAFTAGIVVSKKLAFFTPYLGLGIVKTNFDAVMAGVYPTLGDPVLDKNGFPVLNANNKPLMQIVNKVDPVKVTGTETMPNATFGFRLKFAIMTFHAQYVAQKYATASAGFGFTFR
ncbi:MAG TPA: DUF6588 family protein [Paludibacter sp.]|nr:DUF6588 family protein [Paludibacter sp.]